MAWNWLSDRVPGYKTIAQRLGMQFFEQDVNKLVFTNHKSFQLFRLGMARKVRFILEGCTNQDEPLRVFEYNYTISTGKSSHTYIQHVYSVNLFKPIPSFVIKPQNFFHEIGKWFGMQDIEFNAYTEFNKNYLVKSKEEQAFRSFFNDQILGFLSYETGWMIECNGDQIIYYKPAKRMNEEMIEPFVQVASTMHDLLVGRETIRS